jgi:hypothetical protein
VHAHGYELLQRSVAKLAKANARMLLGSDTGIEDQPFGFTEHREMELLAGAGMTPMQVIVAAYQAGPPSIWGNATWARWRRARPPASSCSTPTRSTTSPTPAASPTSTSPARVSTGRAMLARLGSAR